jgi:hypothetical protein
MASFGEFLSPEIIGLGFNITDQIVLLGMTINRTLNTLESHFDEVITKISRLIEFWDRFNLSMCGRISVCKTCMISQIGYLGCIITPSAAQSTRLQKLLAIFVPERPVLQKKNFICPLIPEALG